MRMNARINTPHMDATRHFVGLKRLLLRQMTAVISSHRVLLKTRASCRWLRMNAVRHFIKLNEVLLKQMTAFIMLNSVLLKT